MNKNNFRKYTQIYTFLGYFSFPLWLFHELKVTIKYLFTIKLLLYFYLLYLPYFLLLKYFFIIRPLVNFLIIKENSYKPAILITQSCLRTYINSLIFNFNKEKIYKLPFKNKISSKFLAIFISNIDIICLIGICDMNYLQLARTIIENILKYTHFKAILFFPYGYFLN